MFFRILLGLVFALFTGVAVAAPVVVDKVRLGQHGKMTRVVLESNKPLKQKNFTLPTPPRFVVDFGDVAFKPDLHKITLPKGGLVNGVRQGVFRPGVVRMVIDLEKAVVASVFTIPASKTKGFRLVMDLKPATKSQIDKRKKEIRKTTPKKHIAPVITKPSEKKKSDTIVVIIDPGHGGVDPGAISRHGAKEKTVVLQVAKKLQKELNKKRGIKAYLTRSRDIFVPLKERVRIAQTKKADIFISIHADAHKNRKVRGGSVYVLSDKSSDKEAARLARQANQGDLIAGVDLSHESNDVRNILIDLTQRETMNKSALLAKEVLKEIGKVTKLRKKNILFAGFRVLKAPEVPSILVETSYLSNYKDEKLLRSSKTQQKFAERITKGVENYIKRHMRN